MSPGDRAPQTMRRVADTLSGREAELAAAAAGNNGDGTAKKLRRAETELRPRDEELAAANVELRDAQQHGRELFANAPDAYLVTDATGVVTDANAAAAQLFNVKIERLTRKRLVQFVAPDHRRQFRHDLRSLETGPPLRRFWFRIRPRARDPIEGDVTASVVQEADGRIKLIRWLIRDDTAATDAARQVLDYQRRLRALAVELARAEERERRQIAVEIHDRISQNLAMAKLRLASIQSRFTPETKARVAVDFYDALFLLEQTIDDTRTLTFELSPPILYELGLVAAIQWLAETLSHRHGVKMAVDGSATAGEALGDDLRSLLFRSVRELLINVVKHAGATAARVSIRAYDGGVRVTVADDGHGIRAPEPGAGGQAGFGLFSMRTRLEEIGGKVEISSIPDAGTRVTLSAPIDTSVSGGGCENGDKNPTG